MRLRSLKTKERCAVALAAILIVVSVLPALGAGTPDVQNNGLVVTDLTDPGLNAEEVVEGLLGPGINLMPGSVSVTGNAQAFGSFEGGDGIIGFDAGAILGSGRVVDVVGPNDVADETTIFLTPGDPDLDQVAGFPTFDAAILEFDVEVPEDKDIGFQYVFGSDEYNEYVGSPFNDVFAFWVNGDNCALTQDGDPVSINTINNGQPTIPETNPQLYINNDPFYEDKTGNTVPAGQLLDTEADGLTVVLDCEAGLTHGVNTFRLAIADTSDEILDSWVLIKDGSITLVDPVAHGETKALRTPVYESQGLEKGDPGTDDAAVLTLGQPGGQAYAQVVAESVNVTLDRTARVEADTTIARVELLQGLVVAEGLTHRAVLEWDVASGEIVESGSNFTIARLSVAGVPVDVDGEDGPVEVPLPTGGMLVLFDQHADLDEGAGASHNGTMVRLQLEPEPAATDVVVGEIALLAGSDPPGLA